MSGPHTLLSITADGSGNEAIETTVATGVTNNTQSLQLQDDSMVPGDLDYDALYAEYFEAQKTFTKTANKCLAKLKLPAMEVGQNNDWNVVQQRMEEACSTLEKAASHDKDLSGIRGKMRKAFRKFCQHAEAGKVIASLIPDDLCGSVLCSGLTVIFTALEKTAFHRDAVYKALERLPRVLESHAEYANLASDDELIHRFTAKLYTEVCLTLEHILRWFLTDAFVVGAKNLLKPSSFSNSLSDRMAEVHLAAKDLKVRGSQMMWSQMKEISTSQKRMAHENDKMACHLEDIGQNIKRLSERCVSYESVEMVLRQSIGPLLGEHIQGLLIPSKNHPKAPSLTSTRVLQMLQYDEALITTDAQSLLQLGLPTAAAVQIDQSRAHFMQKCPRMRAWIAVDEPSLLLVNGGSHALDLSTSVATAKLVGSLLQKTPGNQTITVIPLAYFCSQHRDYRRDIAANPMELALSLFAQLIEHYPNFHATKLQECLEQTDFEDLHSICVSFGRLVKQLPSSVVVFLFIDGVSFFSTPSRRLEEMYEIVGHLVDVYRQQPVATMKMLISSSARTKFLEDLFEDEEILKLPAAPPAPPPGSVVSWGIGSFH